MSQRKSYLPLDLLLAWVLPSLCGSQNLHLLSDIKKMNANSDVLKITETVGLDVKLKPKLNLKLLFLNCKHT